MAREFLFLLTLCFAYVFGYLAIHWSLSVTTWMVGWLLLSGLGIFFRREGKDKSWAKTF